MRTAPFLTLWLSACAPASPPETPTPSTAHTDPPYPPLGPIYNNNELCPAEIPSVVQYRADTEAEWKREGPHHYSNVCKMAMRCGAERFELLLGPAYFGGRSIEIGGVGVGLWGGPILEGRPPKHRPFSIVVRGVGPEPPTLSSDGALLISGDHVTIQNLRFQHAEGSSTGPYIWVQAEQTLTLSNVHVSDGRFYMDELFPIELKSPVINLEDSSFIGNKVGNATCWGSMGHGVCKPRDISTALMELSGDEVNLRRVVFAGNDADRLLSASGRLTLDEVTAVGLEDQTLTDDVLEALTLRNSSLAFGGPKWLKRLHRPWLKTVRPKIKNSLIVNPATLAPGALEALNRTAAEKPPTAAELAAAIRALPKKSQK